MGRDALDGCVRILRWHGWLDASTSELRAACIDINPERHGGFAKFTTWTDWLNLAGCMLCLAGAAMAAGLTLAVSIIIAGFEYVESSESTDSISIITS